LVNSAHQVTYEKNSKKFLAHHQLQNLDRNYPFGCLHLLLYRVPANSEISRVSQYVSKMIIAFDNMKIIHNYRTPVTLRAYSKVFIYIFPIIYGPYFASSFHDFSAQLEYVMPILYSFILVSLDNIQDHLENPFDDVGEDDIRIDTEDLFSKL